MMPVLIILILVTAPTLALLVPQWLRSRERQHLIAVVTTATERGQPIPAELIERVLQPPAPRTPALPQHVRDFRRGVVLLAIALGIACIALMIYAMVRMAGEPEAAIAGVGVAAAAAIPAMLGLAFLLLARRGTGPGRP